MRSSGLSLRCEEESGGEIADDPIGRKSGGSAEPLLSHLLLLLLTLLPTIESILNANFGLIDAVVTVAVPMVVMLVALTTDRVVDSATAAAAAAAAAIDDGVRPTTKGLIGAIGSMLNGWRLHVTICEIAIEIIYHKQLLKRAHELTAKFGRPYKKEMQLSLDNGWLRSPVCGKKTLRGLLVN